MTDTAPTQKMSNVFEPHIIQCPPLFRTGSISTTSSWTELDVTAGITIEFNEDITVIEEGGTGEGFVRLANIPFSVLGMVILRYKADNDTKYFLTTGL